MTSQQFPPGFLWGSGASAYQVEGAWDADGKGPSIWDTSTHSGRWATPDGTSGDVAIDQYNRLDEDLDLARSLGAPMHRFSISWPRILPTGEGTVNPAGLDYYERMVDGLAARGIQSAVNLFHWDLPQSLEDQGGWMNRDTAYRFADFSHIVAARLGDRVAQWWTINEPLNPSLGGYMAGALPPHRALGLDGLAAMHHVLLAHGLSMRALRDAGVTGDRGIILSLSGVRAATDHPDDRAAADRAALFAEKIFLDPLLGRGHIEPVAKLLSTQGVLLEGDEEIIGTPAELIGLNWYSTFGAAAPSRATPMLEDAPRQWAMFAKLAESTEPLGFAIVPIPGAGWMHAHRQLTPGGMRAMLDWVHTEYPELPPIVVTENGIGLRDPIEPDGTIPDTQRIDYMSRALSEIASAIDAGIDVRGYYAWSFIDNLQWNAGFTHRFGLIHVDPVTLVRTPKQSFDWFARVIESNVLEPLLEPVDVAKAVSLGAVENARGLEGLRTVTGRAVRPGLFVRSGALHRLDARSNYELEQLNVTTVIDLRTDAERTGHPSMLSESTRVVHIPLLPDLNTHVESGAMDLASVYEGMIEHRGDALVAVLQEVIGARDAVLVHCTAGKDRTGVVVALLLALLGVGDEAIIANYAESESRLSERFRRDVETLMQQLGGSDALRTTALESPPVLLESLFARIRSQHGSITAYLRAHGLTDEHIARARDKFLEPAAA